MISPLEKQRSKSARRNKFKSPLNIVRQISFEQKSLEKIHLKNSKASSSQTLDTEPKALTKNHQRPPKSSNPIINSGLSGQFKNKIVVSSSEFNRLKQKLQSATSQNQRETLNKKRNQRQKDLKIKILDRISAQDSQNSGKTLRNNKSTGTGSSGSEQIQLLKIENEYFKKIYDDALNQLEKLQTKLKEQKKVHEMQRQIYENEIKKLKRIVDCQREEVSHIICDEQNRYIIVVSSMDKNDEQNFLGIHSDCEEEVSSLSVISKQ